MERTRTVALTHLRGINMQTLGSLPTQGNLDKGPQRPLPPTMSQRLHHRLQLSSVGLNPVFHSHLNLWLLQI